MGGGGVLKEKAAGFFETFLLIYQATQFYITEDHNLSISISSSNSSKRKFGI
jgi:hypothetical protein